MHKYLSVLVALAAACGPRYEPDPALRGGCAPPLPAPAPLGVDSAAPDLPAGTVAVRAVMQGGSERPVWTGATVTLRRLQPGTAPASELRADTSGRAAFSPQPPGTYELRVRAVGLGPRADTIELRSGGRLALVAPLPYVQGIYECWPVARRKPWWRVW